MQDKEFFILFERARTVTKSFTFFHWKILLYNPQIVLIFRLLAKKSQKDFCKETTLRKGHLYSLEKGLRKSISPNTAKKCQELLKKIALYERYSFQEAYAQFVYFNRMGNLTSEDAKRIRSFVDPNKNVMKGVISESKPYAKNEFEEKISSVLQEAQIPFQINSILKAKTKYLVVDFAIPDAKEPKIIIEVRQSRAENEHSQYDRMRGYAVILDHKMRNIKLQYPEMTCIVVLSSKHKPLKKLSPFILAELIDTDRIFFDATINDFVDYLKQKVDNKL